MRVLDVGCGPGTITVGLAKLVAPGQVVGTDLQPAVVERPRALIDAMMAEVEAWAERPDAFALEVVCESVGWAGG
jgi:ubiquinone/menaquinone biosynthesis C-methylase UbiE